MKKTELQTPSNAVQIFRNFGFLTKQYPNWKRLSRKQKKVISKAVLNEAVAQYDFEQDIQVPLEELIGIEEQILMDDIMNIEEMAHFIDAFNSGKFIRFNKCSSYLDS